MCYGSQEYFISCLHPGNFHIREYCSQWQACPSRIEEATIHMLGFCTACQHTAYTEQPRGRADPPRQGGSRWGSYEQMADHYRRRIDAANERLADAQYYFDANPRGRHEARELRHAQAELDDATRGWERDEGEFQAAEIRIEDRRTYEAGGYDDEGW